MALLIDHQAVLRVRAALVAANHPTEIVSLSNTARTAGDAARALGIEVGQVVAKFLYVEKLLRAA
jgi:hypothetical protein